MTDTLEIPSPLTLPDLEHALQQVEPGAVLLPSWLLENIIAADRGITGPRFSIPHDESHVISRERLMKIIAEEELPLAADPPDEPVLILLVRPDSETLGSASTSQVLLSYWRRLFHAQVDAAFRQKRLDGALDAAGIQRRIEKIGRSAFCEAAFVLQKEHAIGFYAKDADIYSEFAAAYLELMHFEPWLVHWYYPAAQGERVVSVLSEDVDAAAIFERTRLPGADEPRQNAPGDEESETATAISEIPREKEHKDRGKGKSLLRKAQAAEQRGNDVRAALFRVRAARVMGTEAGRIRSGAARRGDALAARLRTALQLDVSDYDPWRAVLRSLLSCADLGWWNNERRLLYDLQKVCVCHEREMYSANVVEWLLDRGRRPLRRPQPAQRLVIAHKALRSAQRRAQKARLYPHDKAALQKLLHAAVMKAEARLRTDLRIPIIGALEDGDLRPGNVVEKVAQEKLVDELLDSIVRRGFLNLGNLRDAISRNQLKLNDLSSVRELIGRDQLLRVDRKLEAAVDGIYHRGEIYLRFFQRLSSVLFGTTIGRLLTRIVLIPCLGAFLLLEGLDHSVGMALKKLSQIPVHFGNPIALATLSLLIMGLVNWPAFRAAAARGGRMLWRGMCAALIEFPRWLGRLWIVRFLFTSPIARLLFRYGIKPLAVAGIVMVFLPDSMDRWSRAVLLAGVYVISSILLNSPIGRTFEQTLLHALRVTLPRITWDILVAALRHVMLFFKRLLESVDRVLYAVDEWLRFGSSHGVEAVVSKAILGVIWFYIAYLTRFVVNLLIEPQINPIKHFPVVTVSHKIIIPTAYPMARAFETLGIESVRAGTLAGTIVTCIPGIFGFLAWELRENWKLYRRNRPANLRPVRVGSHGETLAQLLRPGFHSGTLPKLFARVRKTAKKSHCISTREREAAHHVQEEVAAFVERELVRLLNAHPAWAPTPVATGEVELAATRIRVGICCEQVAPRRSAVISFDQRDGIVIASIEERAWMCELPPTQAELLRVALIAFYKRASVNLVAEQVRAPFDIRRGKLIVWLDGRFEREMIHNLSEPSEETRRLLFNSVQVPWATWQKVWDTQTPTEIAELTAQIAPEIDLLSAGCMAAAGGLADFKLSEPAALKHSTT